MSRGRLLALLVPGAMGTLAIAVRAQASRATTSKSAGDPNVLTNEAIIEMAATELPEEVILTEIRTSKTNFTPAPVELDNSRVSASAVKAMTARKNTPPRRGSCKSVTKERT